MRSLHGAQRAPLLEARLQVLNKMTVGVNRGQAGNRRLGALRCPNRRSGHDGLTQAKSPPIIPARFEEISIHTLLLRESSE